MSTTNGNMKSFKVTDKDGNVYVMTPVDTVARQEIDEAKNLQFDEDYFTSEVSQDQTTLNIGLNGVPLGVDSDSPLKFKQDNAQGIVFGSDAPFSTAVAPEYSASGTYKVGDHCMHLGKYYECNTAIATAEAWTAAHWTEIDLDSIIGVKVFVVEYSTNLNDYIYPTYDEVSSAFSSNKLPVILLYVNNSPVRECYVLRSSSLGYLTFTNNTKYIRISSSNIGEYGYINDNNIAIDYSNLTFPVEYGTQCMHNGSYYYCSVSGGIATQEPWDSTHWTKTSVASQIGNVETLLAAL